MPRVMPHVETNTMGSGMPHVKTKTTGSGIPHAKTETIQPLECPLSELKLRTLE